jgi:hypothetical protein
MEAIDMDCDGVVTVEELRTWVRNQARQKEVRQGHAHARPSVCLCYVTWHKREGRGTHRGSACACFLNVKSGEGVHVIKARGWMHRLTPWSGKPKARFIVFGAVVQVFRRELL